MSSNFVSQIACGDHHCLLLTSSGFLYSFGKGENGRLGLGDEEDRDDPCMIYNLLDFTVKKIHTTQASSIVICRVRNEIPVAITHTSAYNEKQTTLVEGDQNIVYTWGKGEGGCLGNGFEIDALNPMPLSLSIEENISKISTGRNHVFALDNKKNCIYAWGSNSHGQLSFPPTVKMLKSPEKVTSIDKKVIDIYCNEFSSACITEKELTAGVKFEEIYSWGILNSDKHAPKRFFKWDSVVNMTFSKNSSYIVTKEVIEINNNDNSPFKLNNIKINNKNRIEIKTLDEDDLDEMDDCEIEIEDEDVLHQGEEVEEVKIEVDESYVIVEGFSPDKSTPSKTPNKSPPKPMVKKIKKLSEEEMEKEWQDDILPNFERFRETEQIKTMIMFNLPKKMRGNIWRV